MIPEGQKAFEKIGEFVHSKNIPNTETLKVSDDTQDFFRKLGI
jgi:hypothetical protein